MLGSLVKKTGRSSSGLEVPFSKLQTVTLPIFGRQSPARFAFPTDLGVVQGWPTGQSHRQRRPINSVLDRRERPRRLSPRGRERTSERAGNQLGLSHFLSSLAITAFGSAFTSSSQLLQQR